MTHSRAKILLLGDSITQQSFWATNSGWGAHLADRYQRRADVLNRGFSGYNTEWFLELARTEKGKVDIFGHDAVKLVTIFFGANDASDAVLNPRHHVSTEKYKSNLKEIASFARSSFGLDVRIVIISPPPVHHDSRLTYQKERYGEKATGELERTLALSGAYATAAREVAEELKTPFLNLWKDMQGACPGENEPWSRFLSDGLHLSREGNEFVGKALVELIGRSFPELNVTPCSITGYCGNSASTCPQLEQVGPWHDEIDHMDAPASFSGRKRKREDEGEGETAAVDAEKAAAAPNLDVIDWGEAMEQCGDDEEFLRELLGELRKEADEQMKDIEEALQSPTKPNWCDIVKLASHSIKGAAANLMCEQLRAAAAELEQVVRPKIDEGADVDVADAKKKLEGLRTAVSQYHSYLQSINV